MNPSTALARVLIDELVRGGVREAVLCPGSRNAPLSFALHDADAAGRLRLHVRIDERTAGFLALGLAKASRAPVVVATTSGTATANLHPAVVEASHAGVSLVVLTADRPEELRGVGANQTIDQVRLYGGAVRHFAEVSADAAVGEQAWRSAGAQALAAACDQAWSGPVHVNVALREPLVPDDSWAAATGDPRSGAGTPSGVDLPSGGGTRSGADLPSGAGTPSDAPGVASEATEVPAGLRTVVVAGDDGGRDGWRARQLAESAGWPLLAEPSSGARSGPNALGPYRLLLDHGPPAGRIERVVAFGRPTLSRGVIRLLSRPEVELIVVSERRRWPDPGRNARLVVPAVKLEGTSPGAPRREPDVWLQTWLDADAAARAAVDSVLTAEADLSGPAVARLVAGVLEPGDLLVAGSSNPIRDLDLAAAPFDHPLAGGASPARRVRILANRGASGIDGTVSTAAGAALAHQAIAGRTTATGPRSYALMGDLSFLHDANGLVIGPDEPRPDLTIVVVNDDGGGIFGLLEQGAPAHADAFERIFGTPTGVDLAALCAATRTPHVLVRSAGELPAALAPGAGLRVVEARVDRSTARGLHAHLRRAVTRALS